LPLCSYLTEFGAHDEKEVVALMSIFSIVVIIEFFNVPSAFASGIYRYGYSHLDTWSVRCLLRKPHTSLWGEEGILSPAS